MALITENQTETLNLLTRTKYRLTQDNGQRIYGPPPDWIGSPPRKTEVFVGSLPRDLFEYDLVPFFEQVGKIYMLRTMLSFSGYNRGYAFIKYCRPEDAERAIAQLNNAEIRPGQRIGVVRSLDNCKLYVGNIPTDKTREEIMDAMMKITEDVTDVTIQEDRFHGTRNRGFAFVEYATHKGAAKARRKLVPANITLWDQPLTVDWATPEPEAGDGSLQVTNLYCRFLKPDLDDRQLHQFFSFNGQLKLIKIKRMKNFAFLNYQTREDAQKALNYLMNTNTKELCTEDCNLAITWAKPANSNSSRHFNYARHDSRRCSHLFSNSNHLMANSNSNHLMTNSNSNHLMISSNSHVHLDPNPSSGSSSMFNNTFAMPPTGLSFTFPNHDYTSRQMLDEIWIPGSLTNNRFDSRPIDQLFMKLNYGV